MVHEKYLLVSGQTVLTRRCTKPQDFKHAGVQDQNLARNCNSGKKSRILATTDSLQLSVENMSRPNNLTI